MPGLDFTGLKGTQIIGSISYTLVTIRTDYEEGVIEYLGKALGVHF
jgi:hypothetical protein